MWLKENPKIQRGSINKQMKYMARICIFSIALFAPLGYSALVQADVEREENVNTHQTIKQAREIIASMMNELQREDAAVTDTIRAWREELAQLWRILRNNEIQLKERIETEKIWLFGWIFSSSDSTKIAGVDITFFFINSESLSSISTASKDDGSFLVELPISGGNMIFEAKKPGFKITKGEKVLSARLLFLPIALTQRPIREIPFKLVSQYNKLPPSERWQKLPSDLTLRLEADSVRELHPNSRDGLTEPVQVPLDQTIWYTVVLNSKEVLKGKINPRQIKKNDEVIEVVLPVNWNKE